MKTPQTVLYVTVLCLMASSASCQPTPQVCRTLRTFEVTVTASDQGNLPAVNVINGEGLNGDLCDNRWKHTWGTTPNGDGGGRSNPHPGTFPGAAWIAFEFDRVHTLKEMWVWNYNAPTAAERARGLKNVVIEYSTDGKRWQRHGDLVIPQADGAIAHRHDIAVDLGGVRAKAVTITAREGEGVGNYNCRYRMYGLSEVRFYVHSDSDTPERHSEADTIPAGRLALEPKRGVSLDRTYHTVPDQPNSQRGDMRLIKSSGFDFVKLIINPAVHKSGSTITNMDYVDAIVALPVAEQLPVVLCVHPEQEFKRTVFNDPDEFEDLCRWYESFARHLASKWTEKQLVLQMMTEPLGNSPDIDRWNSWEKLLVRMWRALRAGMPKHTLILSGDQVGTIAGLLSVQPVPDENVMYAFSFYEPTFFTWQGAAWRELATTHLPYVHAVPYPSNPEIIDGAWPRISSAVPEKLRDDARAEAQLYGLERWNRRHLSTTMRRLAEWSDYYGGGIKLFCGEFGCLDETVLPEDRCEYARDVAEAFAENDISWAWWSYNETLTMMTRDRTPFGPPELQKPDASLLRALLGQPRTKGLESE